MPSRGDTIVTVGALPLASTLPRSSFAVSFPHQSARIAWKLLAHQIGVVERLVELVDRIDSKPRTALRMALPFSEAAKKPSGVMASHSPDAACNVIARRSPEYAPHTALVPFLLPTIIRFPSGEKADRPGRPGIAFQRPNELSGARIPDVDGRTVVHAHNQGPAIGRK